MSKWRNFLLFLVAAVWWFVNWKKIWVIFETSWLRRILFHMFKTRVARFRVENAMTSRWYWKMEIHQRSIKKSILIDIMVAVFESELKECKNISWSFIWIQVKSAPTFICVFRTSQLTKMECFAKMRNGFLRNR